MSLKNLLNVDGTWKLLYISFSGRILCV